MKSSNYRIRATAPLFMNVFDHIGLIDIFIYSTGFNGCKIRVRKCESHSSKTNVNQVHSTSKTKNISFKQQQQVLTSYLYIKFTMRSHLVPDDDTHPSRHLSFSSGCILFDEIAIDFFAFIKVKHVIQTKKTPRTLCVLTPTHAA